MGSYILLLQLERPLDNLRVGRLGSFDFAPGYYIYVGNAFGPGGLPARLAYHQRQHKRRNHWHIDYLRSHAKLVEAWTVSGSPPLECVWCRALATAEGLSIPVRHFGARDTGCPAHLFYSPDYPGIRLLTTVMLGDLPATTEHDLAIEIHLFAI
jgi:Uri superfamily endonuclease